MKHARTLRPLLVVSLGLASLCGCAAPAPQPAPPAPVRASAGGVGGPAAPRTAAVEPPESAVLQLVRRDVEGEALPVRALLYPGDRPGLRNPIARLEGIDPTTDALAPGRYRVLILATPHPFGFEVVLDPERPVRAKIHSRTRAHLVEVETLLPAPPGYRVLERTTLGFGWGPIELDDVEPRPEPTSSGALLIDREV